MNKTSIRHVMELTHREIRALIILQERKLQALEDIAETLEGLLLTFQRKQGGGGAENDK
tara:strand:+ start:1148 stop:1324 length:177 start_codon:yes stop_codon:yes gene_type:complete